MNMELSDLSFGDGYGYLIFKRIQNFSYTFEVDFSLAGRVNEQTIKRVMPLMESFERVINQHYPPAKFESVLEEITKDDKFQLKRTYDSYRLIHGFSLCLAVFTPLEYINKLGIKINQADPDQQRMFALYDSLLNMEQLKISPRAQLIIEQVSQLRVNADQ